MHLWVSDEKLNSLWIILFLTASVLFNLLNVRNIGEIEFWLTVIKVTTIVGLVFLGILLPMGASVGTRELGTIQGSNNISTLTTVCGPSTQCLPEPGFPCTSPNVGNH
jgi:amino acid permease